jgi:PAP2 superfamily protein
MGCGAATLGVEDDLPAGGGPPGQEPTRPNLVREIVLLAAVFLAYRLGRLAITGHDDLAIANAWHVWDVERFLHLPDEETLQDWVLQWPDVLKAANWYYVGVHFPLTLAFLAWGWWKRPPPEYRWARRLIITLTAFALVLHVAMPLAPPRMLSSLGFLDTMAVFGPSAYDGGAATVANQFAAMPSLHVGWSLLIALVVVRTARSRWRWLIVAHPVLTTAVVVVTANHYWIDAVVAALLLGLVLLVTPRPDGVPPSRLWLRLTRRDPHAGAPAAVAGAQAIANRNTGSLVGWSEPEAGSTVTPTESPAAMPVTKPLSSPPRPRTPADCES